MELIIASNNKHKTEEILEVIGKEYSLLTMNEAGFTEDIPETGDTLEENAIEKARFIYNLTGKDVIADDTGLEVYALNGQPGVMSARYAGDSKDSEMNINKLLNELKAYSDRRARFRTIIALICGGSEYLFEGIVEGKIIEERSGNKGFGYDPVFVPEDCNMTFAEMPLSEKNKISHRGRAIVKLNIFLSSIEKQ